LQNRKYVGAFYVKTRFQTLSVIAFSSYQHQKSSDILLLLGQR